MHLMTGGH